MFFRRKNTYKRDTGKLNRHEERNIKKNEIIKYLFVEECCIFSPQHNIGISNH